MPATTFDPNKPLRRGTIVHHPDNPDSRALIVHIDKATQMATIVLEGTDPGEGISVHPLTDLKRVDLRSGPRIPPDKLLKYAVYVTEAAYTHLKAKKWTGQHVSRLILSGPADAPTKAKKGRAALVENGVGKTAE